VACREIPPDEVATDTYGIKYADFKAPEQKPAQKIIVLCDAPNRHVITEPGHEAAMKKRLE